MDEYTEEKTIGSGNYGDVLAVRHKNTGVLYCMKKIDWGNKTPAQQKESKNEVDVMSKLNHPNIVGFIDAFVENKTLHIVMEYADAMDLEKYLVDKLRRREVVQEGVIMRIFVQIALGLRQVHKQHLLHRDLKSANVFLTKSGGVKLGDFGFSKQLSYTLALASTVCGTPYYFAPELCQKTPYNNKADVWSLGVILYEMINLRKPFEARNLPELRKRVVNEEPAPFVATHISDDMKRLCLTLLKKSSSERPSVDALLQMPYVRQYLSAFAESLVEQKDQCSKRSEVIASSHPRKPGEPEFVPAPPQPSAQSKRQQFDRGMMAKAMKGSEVDLDPKTAHPPKDSSERLHHRSLPNARNRVCNDCPITVVSELQGVLELEENCQRLKSDVDDVLSSVENFDQLSEVIGEAESDEERMVREELGDRFVKAVELALMLSEVEANSANAEKLLQQLLTLLGKSKHLLNKLQRVAMQFELDR